MRRRPWEVGLFCLVVMLLSACAPAARQPNEGGRAPGDQKQQAEPAGSGTQKEQQTKPVEPSFLDLVKGAKGASYKVTYRMSGSAQGQTVSGDQIWYYKSPKTRFDFSMTEGGEKMSASMYVLEDGLYMCTSAGGENTCLKMPKDQAMGRNSSAQIQQEVQGRPEQFDTLYKEGRQIAGQQAHCYVVKPRGGAQAGFTEATFCYSLQGVPLFMESKGQGSDFRMEATAFSAAVSDADFKLPSQPMEMPQFPGMPGGAGAVPGSGGY